MAIEKQVEQALSEVIVPGASRSVAELNMIRGVEVVDNTVRITLAATALNPNTQNLIKNKTKEAVGRLLTANKVKVEFTDIKPTELNQINHVVAVMSGKGGVGKSLVAGLIAVALNRRGYRVGILDADLTGPSIPKMFGISTRPSGSDTGILPVLSRSGIDIMSINLLLAGEDDAVIWRGPLIGKAINQFWADVVWGKLDFLLVDLPPGTSDAPLTVMQSLPLDGVIVVFTPQDLTTMVVRKAIKMAQIMKKPVLGVVENMSYLYIPEIDKRVELFGKSKAKEMVQISGAPLLGQLPLDPKLAKLCDEGNIERYEAEIVDSLGHSLAQALSS